MNNLLFLKMIDPSMALVNGLWVSRFAYDSKAAEWQALNADFFKPFEAVKRDAEGVYFEKGDTAYVGLSGSDSLLDWLINLRVGKNVDYGPGYGPIKRHRGYTGNGVAVMHEIEKFSFRKKSRVVLAGHSQGGAVAVSVAMELIQAGMLEPRKTVVVTVGEPCGGDQGAIDYLATLEAKGLKYYRLAHEKDPIPWAGASITGFTHKKKCILLGADGSLRLARVKVNRLAAVWHMLRATFSNGLTGHLKHHNIALFYKHCGIERFT